MTSNPCLKRLAGFLLSCLALGAVAADSASRIPHSGAASAEVPAVNPVTATDSPDHVQIQIRELSWLDDVRGREIPAKLYLPAPSASKPPLVVFSHGLGGSKDGYSYLGRHLAANGIAALHVQHVGSDRRVWQGNPLAMVERLQNAAQEGEAANRAQDVSFALSRLIESGEIDATRIAAAGHSYGANTTMLVAGAQVQRDGRRIDFRDPRIGAAVLISAPPFYREGDPARIVGGVSIPTLHITATGDNIQIPGYGSGAKDRIEVFEAMGGPSKTLAVFKGGSHSMFTDRMGTGGITLNPQVKVATRELMLAFLQQVWGLSPAASIDRWQTQHAPILARFERRS